MKAKGLADLSTKFKASGISPAALVFDLSGKGNMKAADFVLQGVDFTKFAEALSSETKPGDTVSGLWRGATRGGHTEFDTITGDFSIQEGVININPLLMDGPEVAIKSTGDISLPRWTILLENSVLLKQRPDVPEFQIVIKGPLDNPAQTFGQGILEDYLARKITRKVGEKLGGELGGQFGDVLGKALGIPGANGAQPQKQPQDQPQQEPQQQQQPQQQEIRPEQIFEGVLKELIR